MTHRLTPNLQLGIFHKPTQTDNTTIHFTFNQPTTHKLAAYYSHICWMLSFPNTEQARCREWNLISKTAINNGFPLRLTRKIWNAIGQPLTPPGNSPEATRRIWVPFMYHSPLIHKVTKLFRNTPLHIVFKPATLSTTNSPVNLVKLLPSMTVTYIVYNVQPATKLGSLVDPLQYAI
jgi:hypothetical protein